MLYSSNTYNMEFETCPAERQDATLIRREPRTIVLPERHYFVCGDFSQIVNQGGIVINETALTLTGPDVTGRARSRRGGFVASRLRLIRCRKASLCHS